MRWSADDDARLLANLHRGLDEIAALMPGRSPGAIRRRLSDMRKRGGGGALATAVRAKHAQRSSAWRTGSADADREPVGPCPSERAQRLDARRGSAALLDAILRARMRAAPAAPAA